MHIPSVLVVDDEPNLVDLVKGYLSPEGFELLVAEDGPSAVALARSRHPDLNVLDVMISGFDDVEACRQIRQFSDDYLTKPFSPRSGRRGRVPDATVRRLDVG